MTRLKRGVIFRVEISRWEKSLRYTITDSKTACSRQPIFAVDDFGVER